jgi:formate hydrogenlyase subunit 3/multisubunit Na+/H+ antiporter MnhD subunit
MNLPVMDNSLMQYSVLSVVIPLLGAFLLPVLDRVSNMAARALGPAIMLICFGLVVNIWLQIQQPVVIALGGFAAPLGVVFYIDQLSLLFNALVLIIAFLLWPFQASASIREHSLMLLLSGAACGLALSGDLFNIYVFYELVSVASFGLVTAKGNRSCYAAAIRYVFISGFGTVLALTGIALVYTLTGTLNLAHLALVAPIQLNNSAGLVAFALILIGIGVKAELFPVNTWVPEVYATASKRVSALLAGLVSKLAVLVLLRMMVLVFHTEQAYQLVLVLGMLTVVSGELAAWRSRDMSRMLAFSSIGQLGLIFIAFSIPGQQGLFAGIALSLHHMLVKPALFLIAERWGHALKNLSGAAKKSPLAALLFILFSMSLIGIPPLPGFWAKLLTVTALITMQSPLYSFALLVMLVTTVIEANYLFRVIIGFYDKPQTDIPAHKPLSFATSALFAVVLIIAAIFIAPLGDQLNTTAQQAANRDLYITTVFPGVRN